MAKDEKIEARVTKEFKDRVRAAAAKQYRSMSNWLEKAALEKMERDQEETTS